jgi:hypothetical protein
MRLRLAVCLVLAGVAHVHAQQTVTVPPPPSPLPSTFPQFQTYSGCLMSCDTRAGSCQSSCSVSNSPAITFAAPSSGPSPTRSDPSILSQRPDQGTLTQCYLNCNSQALACKQTCTPPH